MLQVTSAEISLAKKTDVDTLIIRGQGNATLLCLDGESTRISVNNPYDFCEKNSLYESVSGKENGICKVPEMKHSKDCARLCQEFTITKAQVLK